MPPKRQRSETEPAPSFMRLAWIKFKILCGKLETGNDAPSSFFELKRKLYSLPEPHGKAMCAPAASLCGSCCEFITRALGSEVPDLPLKWGGTHMGIYVFECSRTPRALVESISHSCELCDFPAERKHFVMPKDISILEVCPRTEFSFQIGGRPCYPWDDGHMKCDFVVAKSKKTAAKQLMSTLSWDSLSEVQTSIKGQQTNTEYFHYPSLDGASEEHWKMIREWLSDCEQHHEVCKRDKSLTPTRLLDVDPAMPDSDIALCSSESILEACPNDIPPYLCLSYCWGGEVSSKTTTTNLRARHNGFSIDELPKTFRDAVLVTRKVGLRYLWIDAICICQDNESGWFHEAAKMDSIYAGSLFTISALWGENSESGLFPRVPIDQKVVKAGDILFKFRTSVTNHGLFVRQRPTKIFTEFGNSPLDQRGWALQERLLAPANLHYGHSQVMWECKTCLLSETGEITTHRDIAIKQTIGDYQSYDAWCSLVERYSCRRLTYLKDTLPAISGLASKFRNSLSIQGRYMAGLWEDGPLRQLLWFSTGFPNLDPVSYRRSHYPSWSWASCNTSVHFERWSLEDPIVLYIKGPTFHFPEGLTHDPTSDYVHGHIGTYLSITGFVQRYSWRALSDKDFFHFYIFWDAFEVTSLPEACWCLRIALDPGSNKTCVILLEEISSSNNIFHHEGPLYKRVGVGQFSLQGYPVSFKPGERPDADYDIFYPNGKPFLTEGRWQEVKII